MWMCARSRIHLPELYRCDCRSLCTLHNIQTCTHSSRSYRFYIETTVRHAPFHSRWSDVIPEFRFDSRKIIICWFPISENVHPNSYSNKCAFDSRIGIFVFRVLYSGCRRQQSRIPKETGVSNSDDAEPNETKTSQRSCIRASSHPKMQSFRSVPLSSSVEARKSCGSKHERDKRSEKGLCCILVIYTIYARAVWWFWA